MKLLHIVFILCAGVLIIAEASKESSKGSGSKESGSKESGSKESQENNSEEESEENVEFPFLVFLIASGEESNSTNSTEENAPCFGVLINSQWILTTASCAQGVTTFEVRLGSNSPDSGGEVMTSEKVIVHMYYNDTIPEHDIALVMLPESVPHDKNIQIIRVKQRSKSCSKSNNLEVIGISGSSESLTLESQKLDLLVTKDCFKYFDFEDFMPTISCGKGKKRESICYGSSSPLVTLGNHAELVGLSVEPEPVCDLTEPARFIRVAMYADWIFMVMELEAESQ